MGAVEVEAEGQILVVAAKLAAVETQEGVMGVEDQVEGSNAIHVEAHTMPVRAQITNGDDRGVDLFFQPKIMLNIA